MCNHESFPTLEYWWTTVSGPDEGTDCQLNWYEGWSIIKDLWHHSGLETEGAAAEFSPGRGHFQVTVKYYTDDGIIRAYQTARFDAASTKWEGC